METIRYASYEAYLASPEWRRRAGRMKATVRKCQLCGHDDRPLEVHHNSYRHVGHEPDVDLVVLCDLCHQHHHRRMLQVPAAQRLLPFHARMPAARELN